MHRTINAISAARTASRATPFALFVLVALIASTTCLITACADAEDASPAKLAGPGDAEAIAPGIAVQCGAASAAGDNVCTEADLEAAIATAVKASGEACEAKIEAARVEWAAADETAKTGAVEEAMAQAGQSFVGVGESLDAGEWAGVDVRMLLGVAMCGAAGAASQPGAAPDNQPVLLRKMETGISDCAESCYAQGCIGNAPGADENGRAKPAAWVMYQWGIDYSATYRQWIRRGFTNKSDGYCCCRRDFSAPDGACTDHAF